MKKIISILTIGFCFAFGTSHAITIFVNKDLNSGGNNGSSWANAFRGDDALYRGIAAAVSGDDIWVAGGTYRTIVFPTGCTPEICGAIDLANRNNSYLLKSGVKMYGNFAGTETSIYQRLFSGNETILTGNIGNLFIDTDNAYHVVTAVNCANTTLLDKFTIQEGNANGAGSITIGGKTLYQVWGGGMLSISSSVQIKNCSFVNNFAESGGGMLNSDNSSPLISNSVFANNTADGGGGVYNHDFSSPTFNNCTIAYNTGTLAGGAMYNYNGSQPAMNKSILWANTGATLAGVANNGGSLSVSESIIQNGISPCTSCPNTNGNIDPLFRNPADLNGVDNRWGNADDGLQLSNCSPAIDKATTIVGGFTDIAGKPQPFDVPFRANAPSCMFCLPYLDLGAYESQNTEPDKIYVNAQNMGFQTGETWETAFTDLGDAIASACVGKEIWVAAGTYKPSGYPAGCTGCTSNRDYAFLLKDEVKIYGGFVGTETDLSQRNFNLNKSIISGDINTIGVATDNVYHILLSINDGLGTKLDGLTIRDGGDDTYYPSLPTISVEGHSFDINTGGGLNNYQSNLQVINCNFISNRAYALGGGILNNFSNSTIQNCSFVTNKGSGMANSNSNPTIQSCSFISNTANFGGGINNIFSSPIINNCTFIANNAQTGGGINNNNTCSPVITNSTFVSNFTNSSGNGGAIMNIFNCNPIIKNTLIWENTSEGISGIANSDGSSVPVVSFSIIQGGYLPCTSCPNTNGNINPQFVNFNDPDGIDNKIQTFDDGLALKNTSPAINTGTNTGTPTTDILGNLKVANSDIGAYEFMPKNICINNRFIADAPIEIGTHVGDQKVVAIGTVGTGTNVVFDAPSITLLPGFKTENNAIFSTRNVGCIEVSSYQLYKN